MVKSHQPYVSIGLPVFNGGKTLRKALDCLLAQDYTDFELIISDNASSDNTQEICIEYASYDTRVRYIRQPQNLGSPENFNFVLQAAHGKYFMWAATDDEWSNDFVRSLLERLDNEPEAVGAFCPYQLIEDETGMVIDGIWECDYEHRYAFMRLLKFTWYYRDTCIYGLFRKKSLYELRFKPWAWINSNTPYNIVYPMVYYLLSKGNFLLVGEKPLWFKSVTITHGHTAPFMSNPLLAYLAHIIRKINLSMRSLHYIYRGSQSAFLSFLMLPILLLRLLRDCIIPIYAAIRIWSTGRKISQLSPHEIWQLGVR
jgi:glycosyltransferase involved in cell wall biosynthesis